MRISIFIFLLSCFTQIAMAQTAMVRGVIKDQNKQPLQAQISVDNVPQKNLSALDGTFEIIVSANRVHQLQFKGTGLETKIINVILDSGEVKNLEVELDNKVKTIKATDIIAQRDRNQAGVIYLDAKEIEFVPTAVGGVEALIKQFVGTSNEMTSQYNVRGGNFDENLVYINDFEVYRPYLVRSGQQEGLSVIDPDLVKGISFSTGGFQAKYGDKMSSVLDIEYKRPKYFAGSVTLSLLGLGMHLEGVSRNQKTRYLFGARQKSNQYFLQSQPTQGVYNPSFTDIQLMIDHQFNKKWSAEIFGNYARNRFYFLPKSSYTATGTFNDAIGFEVGYEGSELDRFDSRFIGISTTFHASENSQFKWLLSHYQTIESENVDIIANYNLGEIGNDPSDPVTYGKIVVGLGAGEIHNYARNKLNMGVTNLKMIAYYNTGIHFIQYGFNISQTGIRDYQKEWRRQDSAGYNTPIDQYVPYMYSYIQDSNSLKYTNPSIFIQDNVRFANNRMTLNYGLRVTYQTINTEWLVSPRVQFSYKLPQNKETRDIVLRVASGLYSQPNFYREMRNLQGAVDPSLLAQKSFQTVAGMDYNFKFWNRPFKWTSEAYYKSMWDMIPYEYDNIRIRYYGENASHAYSVGWDNRLYGEFVNGAESWISLGVMKTAENLNNDYYYNQDGTPNSGVGYIPRPTDSRVNFGMFYQDYLKNNPNFKVHLNLAFSKGLPTGPPDHYRAGDTLRLPDYKRIDIGFSALLLDKNRKVRPYYSMYNKLESIWLSLEVLNLIGNRNTLSYNWIPDNNTGRTYLIPNQLTSRLINLRMVIKF